LSAQDSWYENPQYIRRHPINQSYQISVAYIDPGNYATDVAAGATYRFRLLFIVLMSNIFAIFLQSLCIKLGSVSGLNLAEACRAFLPRWLNIFLYIMAEVAVGNLTPDCSSVTNMSRSLRLTSPKSLALRLQSICWYLRFHSSLDVLCLSLMSFSFCSSTSPMGV